MLDVCAMLSSCLVSRRSDAAPPARVAKRTSVADADADLARLSVKSLRAMLSYENALFSLFS